MQYIKFFIVTFLFIWIAHYAAVFPHEYAHSIMAWLLGYKAHPFNIDYGGKSIANLLLLVHIDENNNYQLIYQHGARYGMALIGFAGPGIANGGLYLLSLWALLKSKTLKEHHYLYYFIFWFNFINLANLYDYLPIRTFATHGDIAHILTGLGSPSPWWVIGFGGPVITYCLYYFFSKTLPQAYQHTKLRTQPQKQTVLVLTAALMFGYFAIPGLLGYGITSYYISIASFVLIPFIILLCWRFGTR